MFLPGNSIFIASYWLLHVGTVPAFYKVRGLLRSVWDVWYNARMGLVKTRRLAAMQKQQRAKVAMKPPMKGGAGKGVPRQFAAGAKASLKAF